MYHSVFCCPSTIRPSARQPVIRASNRGKSFISCPCLRYEAASPMKKLWLVNAVSFLPFPFPIFISKCGTLRLPWSQYWSLASSSAKSINVRNLVCRAHIPIPSTFFFAIRQLLAMGFELMSVLGMGRGFPGPVIPLIFHISTCYLCAFISLMGTMCRGCQFLMS